MTIHASANTFPGPVRVLSPFRLTGPMVLLPGAIGTLSLTRSHTGLLRGEVSACVLCLPSSGVRVPPRPVSQSNIATRL